MSQIGTTRLTADGHGWRHLSRAQIVRAMAAAERQRWAEVGMSRGRVLLSGVLTVLGCLGLGCSHDQASEPKDVVSWASVDSVWVAAVHGDSVVLGVAGGLPNTCAEFDGASVTFAEPDSYLVVGRSRFSRGRICGSMVMPYAVEIPVLVRQGSTPILVRGRTTYGDWRVWRLDIPS